MGGWGDDDVPESPEEAARRRRVAENGTRLFKRTAELIAGGLKNPATFEITVALICELNGIAVAGEDCDPGVLRTREVQIGNAVVLFEPPPATDVPALLEDACSYINAALARGPGSTLHAAAYALWRLNWIHPFGDGNGRTSRAICDAVLCVGFGRELPGTLTIDEQISNNRYPYWDALEAADRAWKNGVLEVSEMETLLAELLERQLRHLLSNG